MNKSKDNKRGLRHSSLTTKSFSDVDLLRLRDRAIDESKSVDLSAFRKKLSKDYTSMDIQDKLYFEYFIEFIEELLKDDCPRNQIIECFRNIRKNGLSCELLSLKDTLTNRNKRLANLERELDDMSQQLGKNKFEFQNLEFSYHQLVNENVKLTSEITQMEIQLSGKNVTINTMSQEISKLRFSINSMNNEKSRLERKFLDSDKSELSKLKSQIIQKDETISMLNFKNQLIKNENETLRERNNELNHLKEELDQKVLDIHNEMQNLKWNNEHSKNQLFDEYQTKESQIQALEDQIKFFQEKQYVIENLNEKLINENEEYVDNNKNIREENTKLVTEVKTLKYTLNENKKALIQIQDEYKEHKESSNLALEKLKLDKETISVSQHNEKEKSRDLQALKFQNEQMTGIIECLTKKLTETSETQDPSEKNEIESLKKLLKEKETMLIQKNDSLKNFTSCFEMYNLLSDGSVDINSIPKSVLIQQNYPYYDYLTKEENGVFFIRSNKCEKCNTNFKTYDGMKLHQRLMPCCEKKKKNI